MTKIHSTGLAECQVPPGSPLNDGGPAPAPSSGVAHPPQARTPFRAVVARALAALQRYIDSRPGDRLSRSQLQSLVTNARLPLELRQGALFALLQGTPRPRQRTAAKPQPHKALADGVLTLAECNTMLRRAEAGPQRTHASSGQPIAVTRPGPRRPAGGMRRLALMLRQLATIAQSMAHGQPAPLNSLLARLKGADGKAAVLQSGDSFVLAAVGIGPQSPVTATQLMQLSHLLATDQPAARAVPTRARGSAAPAMADLPKSAEAPVAA